MEKIFTGAVEREPNVTDFHLGSLTPTEYPESFNTPYTLPIEDQQQLPTCGAHAGAYLKDIFDNFRVSPEYLWKKIKQIDNFPPESGTDMLSIMKALSNSGTCDFTLLGDDSSLSITTYTDPTILTPQMATDALTRRIGTYAFAWNPSFETLKASIFQHKAVIMLLRVGAEWWKDDQGNTTWDGSKLFPLKTNIPITSGHFVVATGYDANYIYFINEWSAQWGNKGMGFFWKDYMYRCTEIGTAIDLSASYTFTMLLKYGMHSQDVGMLQSVLKKNGYYTSTIDSVFGKLTLAAVKSFQNDHGLVVDGIVGNATNIELNKLR